MRSTKNNKRAYKKRDITTPNDNGFMIRRDKN